MRFLVLGAGLQGSACAYDLLQSDAVRRVVLADVRTDTLPPFLHKLRNDARLELVQADARDGNAVREVTEAKLLSQRAAYEVAETAFRILDGDLEMGRAMRDTRLGPIGGGTDEVMKEILAKQLGL